MQVSGSILPTKVLLNNDLVKPFLLYSIYLSYSKIIFCTVSIVFDIFTDLCINCGNSRSNPTSKPK